MKVKKIKKIKNKNYMDVGSFSFSSVCPSQLSTPWANLTPPKPLQTSSPSFYPSNPDPQSSTND